MHVVAWPTLTDQLYNCSNDSAVAMTMMTVLMAMTILSTANVNTLALGVYSLLAADVVAQCSLRVTYTTLSSTDFVSNFGRFQSCRMIATQCNEGVIITCGVEQPAERSTCPLSHQHC